MRRLMLTSVAAAAAMAASSAGAQAQEARSCGVTPASAPSEPVVVGLVQIDLSHPFHLGEVDGANEAARRCGFELRVTSGEGDVNKQIQAFENLINEGVDVISVNFIDAAAFGPAMQRAQEAGVPVVCLHSRIEGCAAVLGFDERHTGNIVGEYAVELLREKYGEPKGKVANLQGLLGQGLNEDRSGGFTDVTGQHPDIEVVAQEPTNWDPARAVSIMENWLTAYPDLDLVYGNSDGLTVPAANVARRAGKDILFVSVDGSEGGLEGVKNGLLESTVLLAPQYSGFWKVYLPYQIAIGQDVPDEHLIRGVLVTPENVDAILQLGRDQIDKIQSFPFEEPLTDIVDTYLAQ